MIRASTDSLIPCHNFIFSGTEFKKTTTLFKTIIYESGSLNMKDKEYHTIYITRRIIGCKIWQNCFLTFSHTKLQNYLFFFLILQYTIVSISMLNFQAKIFFSFLLIHKASIFVLFFRIIFLFSKPFTSCILFFI